MTVDRLVFSSRWLGFADPCHSADRLVLERRGDEFVSEDASHQVPAEDVEELHRLLLGPAMHAPDFAQAADLFQPGAIAEFVERCIDRWILVETGLEDLEPAECRDPARLRALRPSLPACRKKAFDWLLEFHERVRPRIIGHLSDPVSVLSGQFGSVWTDDYPRFRVALTSGDDRTIARSESQYAFMVPWSIEVPGSGAPWTTFDIRIGRTIARLLPEPFLARDRLAGSLDLLLHHSGYLTLIAESLEWPIPSATPGRRVPEDDSMRRVFAAARSGNEPRTRALLAQGVDIDAADETGSTALMSASAPPFEDRARFELLVRLGADPDRREGRGLTGLMMSAAGWMTDAVRAWIAAGADVDARSPRGETALMMAARGAPEIVDLLLAAGADPRPVDEDGDDALVWAVEGADHAEPAHRLAIVRRLAPACDRQRALDRAQERLRRSRIAEQVANDFGAARAAEQARLAIASGEDVCAQLSGTFR